MDYQTNRRETQAVGAPFLVENPCLAPSHIAPSTEPSNEIFPENNSTVDQEQSSDVFDPQSLIVPANEDEDYDLYLLQLLTADFCTASDEFMPYLNPHPLRNVNSNEQPNEIAGGFSENTFMDIGSTSYFNDLFCDLPPLHFDELDERSKNMCMDTQNYQINYLAGTTTMEPSSEVVAPPNTAVLAVENEQPNEIAGGFSENTFMDIGTTSYFNDLCCDLPPLHFDELSKIMCMDTQSYQINYLAGTATMEPSSEVVAPPNTAVLAVENGQRTTISQPIMFDRQMTGIPLAFPAVGYPPPTSYCPLDYGFCQSNTAHTDPFDGISTSIGKLQEYHFTNDRKRILENGEDPPDNGKKRGKPDDGRRRCSCKKSKCIQRYCECFYSGFFCDDACECEGCNNTVEHAPLVFKKREEIKRKNSLAFTSKIEQVEDGYEEPHRIQLTRKTKRHRRGCSCTKTKCLQNYCECYQADVRCSDRCRCKGCANIETREHDVGSANFVTGEAMNNNINSHGFHINGGRMFPQANASDSSIGRQAQLALTSSVVPLQQWQCSRASTSSVVPLQQWQCSRVSTSAGTSIISNPTFGPDFFNRSNSMTPL